ncbi:MAG: STAS domain-containing protein [Solirubrobacterales bacterium]
MNSSERARQFDLVTSVDGDTTRIRLTGELDIASADVLSGALESTQIDAGATLAVDMTDVGFMDSTGLRLLIAANRRAIEGDYKLVIVTGESPAKRVLELTRMDEHMQVVTTLA